MGGLKTFYVAAIAMLSTFGTAVEARPFDPLTREFAYCAGRLSAQMEFQWLISDPASDRTVAQRSAMVTLLESVMDPDRKPDVMHLRISAKMAHSALLTRAHFSPNSEIALHAHRRATAEIGTCLSLILS
ncbi:hypothetical protein [Celeribacter arenosi]|uniref:Uncharacterized protein n=1 Tax=Celeribacter arenosi TaxID=792649 RepID=A0ABP7JUV7_9RHOB